MYESGINTAEFFSTMIFQVALPIAALLWTWAKSRAKRGEFRVKHVRAVSTASRKVDAYV